MTISDLQQRLAALGFYRGEIDGLYGEGTRSALLAAFHGPDTPLQAIDVQNAANALSTTPAHVRTVRDVEAAGAGFVNGLPKVLFEGHIFSKLTGHKFDARHPAISYPHWDRTKYPKTQDARFGQILDAVALDVDAALSAASYGAFQILGENHKACGYATPLDFVLAMCQTEGAQLIAFVNFLKTNRLDAALRENRWSDFARGYNGSAYAQNHYDVKLANAFAKESRVVEVPVSTPPPITAPVITVVPPQPEIIPPPVPPLPQPAPIPATVQETQTAGIAAIIQMIVNFIAQFLSKKVPA
jgi:peptidoglycan hydrolase-like protein with peptidoglycan-binding domain